MNWFDELPDGWMVPFRTLLNPGQPWPSPEELADFIRQMERILGAEQNGD